MSPKTLEKTSLVTLLTMIVGALFSLMLVLYGYILNQQNDRTCKIETAVVELQKEKVSRGELKASMDALKDILHPMSEDVKAMKNLHLNNRGR